MTNHRKGCRFSGFASLRLCVRIQPPPMKQLCSIVALFVALLAHADKPNVLFIAVDDLNCDLGSYGHQKTLQECIERGLTLGYEYFVD